MNLNLVQVAICLPARNELQSLKQLLPEIAAVKGRLGAVELHVVVFDDGSVDGTSSDLVDFSSSAYRLSILRSDVTLGKAHALARAFRFARDSRADFIFMMDADGQDDPRYLPRMLEKLTSGAEVVNGRRINREHSWTKREASRIFNGLARALTGVRLLDLNSGLKGFSQDVAAYLENYLYGELHRVILVVLFRVGFRVDEVRVVNRKRTAGKTKYGAARGWRGLFDLLTFEALMRYQSRPGHLIAGIGVMFLSGALLAVLAVAVFGSAVVGLAFSWISLPLLLVGLGTLLLGLGFVADLVRFLGKSPEYPVRVITQMDSPTR